MNIEKATGGRACERCKKIFKGTGRTSRFCSKLCLWGRKSKIKALPRGNHLKRFWSNVDKSTDCWIWKGALSGKGYGLFGFNKIRKSAHIISFELLNGLVPSDRELDHTCKNPPCINPSHLEPVTHQINMLRGNTFARVNKSKTHCPKGHEYNSENTRMAPNGSRLCRECDRISSKMFYHKKKAIAALNSINDTQ